MKESTVGGSEGYMRVRTKLCHVKQRLQSAEECEQAFFRSGLEPHRERERLLLNDCSEVLNTESDCLRGIKIATGKEGVGWDD